MSEALSQSGARFMLSTWDHNEYRRNEYIDTVWAFCHKVTREHFYHVGAKQENRNPVTEALLTNYVVIAEANDLPNETPLQLSFAF